MSNIVKLYKTLAPTRYRDIREGDIITILNKSIFTRDCTVSDKLYKIIKVETCNSDSWCSKDCITNSRRMIIIDDDGTECCLCDTIIGNKYGRELK